MESLTIEEILARLALGTAVLAFLILCLNWARHPGRILVSKGGEHSKKMKTMDLILVIVGLMLLAFTVVMIVLFVQTGAEPSTLETCVFAALGGECGVMGWIKTTKERNRERQWQKEDETQREEDEPE